MWWVVGLFIGGYLLFIAFQFVTLMARFLFLTIRDAAKGEPK